MFEKEAEEIAKDIYIHHFDDSVIYPNVLKAITVGVQKGAEFGYNKGYHDAEEHYMNVIDSQHKLVEESKANEWHYVKDKDYPKDNKPVLCILGDIDSDNCEVGYYNDVGSGEPWYFGTYHLPDDDGDNAWGVIAWKEIVLPELKESE